MNYPVKYHFKRILTSVLVKNMNVNTNLTFSSHFLKYHKRFFVNLSLKCSFVYQFFLWKKNPSNANFQKKSISNPNTSILKSDKTADDALLAM